MAHHPEGLRRFLDLAGSLWGGGLTAREREIAILAVTSASGAAYPLGWHLLDAEDAGLSESETRTAAGLDGGGGLDERESAIARFARDLTVTSTVGDDTFGAVAEFMDERQIVELTMLVGMYRLVACVANALAVELDAQPADALRRYGVEA
jgi:alkylhydroperoxidase family enzyme